MDFSRTRISLRRSPTSYSKVRSAIGSLLRRLPSRHARLEPGAYINVGCGPNVVNSFVNIDYQWVPGLDICCDITRGLPMANGIAGGIFSEHCLEHLPLDSARFVLRECLRVLAPKSMLRIVVPDLEFYARTYVRYLAGETVTLPGGSFSNRTGTPLPVAMFNELFLGSGHRFIFDYEALSGLLREAGFADVRRCTFGTGADSRLLIDSPGRAWESLYVEAVKS